MKELDLWLNIIANFLTVIASSIAIYIFFFNREKISSAINFILSYSNQLTLSELKWKIEKLNDFTVNDNVQKLEVINILHEIEGQIIGNKVLNEKLSEQLQKVKGFTSNTKSLTEPKKRSLVSELRESIRNIDASNYGNLINKEK